MRELIRAAAALTLQAHPNLRSQLFAHPRTLQTNRPNPHQRSRTSQNKQSEFSAPLTSFDWNEADPKRLGTSSIDTTCTIWDIEVRRGWRRAACGVWRGMEAGGGGGVSSALA